MEVINIFCLVFSLEVDMEVINIFCLVFSLEADMEVINAAFSKPSVEEIVESLGRIV